MNKENHTNETHTEQGGHKSYAIGFGLSVTITLVAFALVQNHVNTNHAELSHQLLQFIILALAFVQLVIQAVFFLHLGHGKKPRWNLLAFLFMILVAFIVVAGSIWIMTSLNYNMTPTQVEEYIFDEERIDPR